LIDPVLGTGFGQNVAEVIYAAAVLIGAADWIAAGLIWVQPDVCERAMSPEIFLPSPPVFWPRFKMVSRNHVCCAY
jgi:hypothetical protein